jgi:plasmid stabilization system protein ParE
VSYQVRFASAAADDLQRLFDFLAEQDINAAEQALDAIRKAIAMLQSFPFSCRKAAPDNPFLRELIISFGNTGYVALFEIENADTVMVLAIRHQREDDLY